MSFRSIRPPDAMRHIHLDAVGGIAGDMFVAALLDAFPDLRPRVLADAAAALPEGYEGQLRETRSGILRGLGFGLAGQARSHALQDREHDPGDHRDHERDQHHADHEHDQPHRDHPHGDHPHRDNPHSAPLHADHRGLKHGHDHDHRPERDAGTFLDMVGRIRAAPLAEGTAGQAVAILTLIAEVEAQIHQVPIDAVRFHEIADWDSLLDVVATGSIAAALAPARWTVSPLPRGGGLVRTRHGMLPVPAPATAALLTGFAWRDDGVGGERVTPTGAAILRHLVGPDGGGAFPTARLIAIGTGAGTRTLPGIPNVLRALVFEADPLPAPFPWGRERIVIISFEIDDMTGEEIAVSADRLRSAEGVLDLNIGQVHGKKNRPMQSFRLLARPERADAVIARCFLETSTIGLRVTEEQRVVLPRWLARTDAGGIEIGVKTVDRDGQPSTKAESDDLAADSLEGRRRLKWLAEQAAPG